MNNIVPVAPNSFADLQMIPLQREVPRSTPLEEILAAVYRQRFVIAACVSVCVILAAVISLAFPRQYTAQASVQLDQQTPQVLPAANQLDPEPSIQDADRFLQTQVDRLRSRSISERVISDLHLDRSPAALKAIGVVPSDPRTTHELIVAQLQERMKTALGLKTRLVQVSFTSGNPVVSARVANGFANALFESNMDAKQQASDRAKQYLLQQLSGAKQRLETSEQEMLRYARRENLTATVVPQTGSNDRGGSLPAQQLGSLTDSLSQATTRRIDAQQRWAQVQNTPALQLPEVESNNAIQTLVSQRAQLQATLDEDLQRHTENYPTVKETAAKVRQIDSQINSFASSIKSSFYGQYLAAAQQERQLQQAVSGIKGAAMSERERSVGYNALSREVETNKAFYDGLLQRYKDVATAAGAAAANVSIVDRAWPPLAPDSSNLVRNVALGGMAGLILALFAGGIRERMHHVVRTSDDLERALNLPALGVVPRLLGSEPVEEALEDPHSAQAEAYHSIAAALLESSAGVLPKTLLITSSTADEGKSTTAFGIARSLSAMGKRVLLIDGDLRRPSATKLIGSSSEPGLSQVLAGAVQPEQTIKEFEGGAFNVVEAGDPNCNPITLLSGDRIKSVFDELAKHHDIVIVDGPPVMGLADAVLLARSVENVLVVVEANRTHLTEVDVAISRLPQSNVIGAIVTKFDAKSAGVRYGSYDYYTYEKRESRA
jgi:polysaccharide biosynthesis transport protein